VILALTFTSGRYVRTGTSSPIVPSCARASTRAAVKVLLTLAMAKDVDAVTGVLAATFARPLTPTHELPSGKRIVTEIPGTPYRSRSWSRRFCRERRVAGVAVRPARSGGRTPMVATTGRAARGGAGI
jgi:hypothetical protein